MIFNHILRRVSLEVASEFLMTFEELNLIKPILSVLKQKGYLQPTPIQEQAIPLILAGRDLFGNAQTGTGKTAAFALPLLQMMDASFRPNIRPIIRTLILAPTRELALQISENFMVYGSRLGLQHATIFGGVSPHSQIQTLRRGIETVIATPGRLLDLAKQGYVDLKNVQYLVLDEADQMLDMGFINDIKKIIAMLPTQRQTLFFSATAPVEIRKLSDGLLKNPAKISVAPISAPAEMINQTVYYVKKEDKKMLLRHVLKNGDIEHALVFTRTKHGADKVVKELMQNGIKAEAIHGNKSQNARERALHGFKTRKIRILVATDIASRGIDVDKLTHVINFELPEVPETYVHRIGRTGRAGESGMALSFCASEEMPLLRNINKLMNKKIDVVTEHPFVVSTKTGGIYQN